MENRQMGCAATLVGFEFPVFRFLFSIFFSQRRSEALLSIDTTSPTGVVSSRYDEGIHSQHG